MGNSTDKLCFVLGCHRSGTSCLARIINLMGYDVGTALMKASSNNPKGYWEDVRAMRINDRILSANHSNWNDFLALNLVDTAKIAPGADEMIAEMSKEYGNMSYSLLKDPRNALTLPFWENVFAHKSKKYVFIIRHPFGTALSLHKRNKFSLDKSLAIWFAYNLNILKNLIGKDFFSCDYKNILSLSEETLTGLSTYLELPDLNQEKLKEIKEFVDPNLNHMEIIDEAKFENLELLELSKSFYCDLQNISDPKNLYEKYKNKLNDDLILLYKQTKNAQLTKAQQEITSLKKKLTHGNTQLTKAGQEITSLKEKLTHSDALLEATKKSLNAKQELLMSTRQAFIDTKKELNISQAAHQHELQAKQNLEHKIQSAKKLSTIHAFKAVFSKKRRKRFIRLN